MSNNKRIQPVLKEERELIDFFVTTPKSNRLVRQMIPVLVHMAKTHQPPVTYGQLAASINHRTARIGFQLGCIIDILECLSQEIGAHIPQLTGLSVQKSSGLPGGSIDRIRPGYKDMSIEEKGLFVAELNEAAYAFDGWDDVLAYLGL